MPPMGFPEFEICRAFLGRTIDLPTGLRKTPRCNHNIYTASFLLCRAHAKPRRCLLTRRMGLSVIARRSHSMLLSAWRPPRQSAGFGRRKNPTLLHETFYLWLSGTRRNIKNRNGGRLFAELGAVGMIVTHVNQNQYLFSCFKTYSQNDLPFYNKPHDNAHLV